MTMRTIPVDLGKLAGFTCSLLPAPNLDRETGEPKKDRKTGLPVFLVGVNVSIPEEREAYSLMVQVPGEPAGLALNQVVRVYDLTASPWDRDGRSGITYRASAITPSTQASATSSAPDTGAAGKAMGGKGAGA